MYSIDTLTKYLLQPTLKLIKNVINSTTSDPIDEIQYEVNMTYIANEIDNIYWKTNSFKFSETIEYFKNDLSNWTKKFNQIHNSQINKKTKNIRTDNKQFFQEIKGALKKHISYLEKCYKEKESQIIKTLAIQEINLAFNKIAQLENLNEKSQSNNLLQTIIQTTEEIMKKMIKNIISNCDPTIEKTNDYLCILKQKSETTSDKFNETITSIYDFLNNLNSQTKDMLKGTTVNTNKKADMLEVLEKFNNTINSKDCDWKTFQENNKERFDKDWNYIKIHNQNNEEELVKERFRFKITWKNLIERMEKQIDLYNNLETYLKNNNDENKFYKPPNQEFMTELNNIIKKLNNVKSKIENVFTNNYKKFQPYKPRYGIWHYNINNNELKKKHLQWQNNVYFKEFKNIVNQDIVEALLPQISSFQEKEFASLNKEILELKNKKIIDTINLEIQEHEITEEKTKELINEFNKQLESVNSREELDEFCLNTSTKIKIFIDNFKIDIETCKTEIIQLVQEFNLKINTLSKENMDSYNNLVNEFIERFSQFKDYFKINNNFYAKLFNQKINQLILLTKDELKPNYNIEKCFENILNTKDIIFDEPIFPLINDLEKFKEILKKLNSNITSNKSTINNIKKEISDYIEVLSINTDFIFNEQYRESYNKLENLINKELSIEFCTEIQNSLEHKCQVLPATSTSTPMFQTSNKPINAKVHKEQPSFDKIGGGEVLLINNPNLLFAVPVAVVSSLVLVVAGVKRLWNTESTKECDTLDSTTEQKSKLLPQTLV